MAVTRAELSARIARAETRRESLVAERDDFYLRSKSEGDEQEAGRARRAALYAQYLLYSSEVDDVERALLVDRAALDALRGRLAEDVLAACRAKETALEALLDAECTARDAGEHELAVSIDRARKALVHVGLGTLHDAI